MVEQVQKEHAIADVEVWAMDEQRLGLKPVLRNVWVPEGEQPMANVHWRFQWLWLYGFVHPESGETKRVDSTQSQYQLVQSCAS